jgi:uncharacterized protein (TIGR02597 family)
MKKFIQMAACAVAAFAAAGVQAQTTRTAEPSGILSVTCPAGLATLVSSPFVRSVEYMGTVASRTADSITASSSGFPFTFGVFNESSAADNNYYVEITSGRYIGLTMNITSNDNTTVYLSTNFTTLPTVETNANFVIRKSWNLSTLFATNSPGFRAGASANATTTRIQTFNPATLAYETFFLRSGASGGWRSSTNVTLNAGFRRLDPNNSFLVLQATNNNNPVTFRFSGESRNLRTLVSNVGGQAGRLTLIGNPNPLAMTIGPTNLLGYVSDSGFWNTNGASATNSVRTGATSANADQVQFFNPTNLSYIIAFRNTGPAGSWRSSVAPSVNSNSLTIAAGAAVYYRRLTNGPFALQINPIFKD